MLDIFDLSSSKNRSVNEGVHLVKKGLRQEGSVFKGLHLELVIDIIIIYTIVGIIITSASNFIKEFNLTSFI